MMINGYLSTEKYEDGLKNIVWSWFGVVSTWTIIIMYKTIFT